MPYYVYFVRLEVVRLANGCITYDSILKTELKVNKVIQNCGQIHPIGLISWVYQR